MSSTVGFGVQLQLDEDEFGELEVRFDSLGVSDKFKLVQSRAEYSSDESFSYVLLADSVAKAGGHSTPTGTTFNVDVNQSDVDALEAFLDAEGLQATHKPAWCLVDYYVYS